MEETYAHSNDSHGDGAVPAYSLLMPESREDTTYRETHLQRAEQRVAATAPRLKMTVLHAVKVIDVEADEHPHQKTNPRVGRQEEHQADTHQNAADRDERHKGNAEGIFAHAFPHGRERRRG